MKSKNLLITLISVALCLPAVAQSPKAAEQVKTTKSAPAKKNHGRIFQSHSKQVGAFGPFEVHSLRIRGLDSPNVSAAVIYDPRSETYTVVGPATGAGLGSAILGAAGNVGSSAVFGLSLRPTRINENISNNSESEGSSAKSTSEGGDAVSVSKSEGGDAVSISKSDSDARSSSTATAKNSNSIRNSNTSVNSNVNVNSNEQSQNQGQVQGQSNQNTDAHGHGHGHHKPKKSKKSKK